jgi:ribonuclease J
MQEAQKNKEKRAQSQTRPIKPQEQRAEPPKKAKRRSGKPLLRVIPLGGLHEIGKNITVLEYQEDILIVDCGMSFPEDEMFGIDVVIPDFDYLVQNRSKVKGLILTHGHEDHIGAIPYLLKKLPVPIYGTRLTLGLVESRLAEHGLKGDFHTISAGQKFKVGPFGIEAIRITHSIADAICFSIDTPMGRIFHTGDFKIDYTPVDGEPIDFQKLAAIGKSGVQLMLSDSTNAVRKGYTDSEQTLSSVMQNIFRNNESRIIVATFASNVHRIQTIIDTAVQFRRKVALSGRSMLRVLELAVDLGYIKIPANVMVDLNEISRIPDRKLVIITTGSQGEPMSALARMSNKDHRSVSIKKGDTIILSSTPIPGNEKTVSNVVNKLYAMGAEVLYSDIADIHVSGHACQQELKLMLSLIKPRHFMPVHGEYRHLHQHAQIAEDLGVPSKNIFLMENGQMLEMDQQKVVLSKERAEAEPVFVDGLGVGDIGEVVLRDRRLLSESGLIIVVASLDASTGSVAAGPDIISRGFVYVKENEDLIDEVKAVAASRLATFEGRGRGDRSLMKNAVREELRGFIYRKTKRSPVILTIFMEA